MSDSLIHWLTFIGGVFVQAVIAAFVYGKLTQTVSGHSAGLAAETKEREKEVARIDDDQRNQWSQINKSREDIGKLKGKIGINGA